jgi:hypothetical protein
MAKRLVMSSNVSKVQQKKKGGTYQSNDQDSSQVDIYDGQQIQ